MKRGLFLGLMAAPALWAQFDLYLVKGAIEAPAPQVLDFGAAYPGEAAALHFRLRNTSDRAATLTVLAVDGSGFSLSGAPALPATLEPQAGVEFAAVFQAVTAGSYSAALRSNGVSHLLIAAVLPSLTPEIELDGVIQSLGPVAFGSVELGGSASRRIVLENLTAELLAVPPIHTVGAAFALAATSPAGALLPPRQSASFELLFRPLSAGAHAGSLVIGDRSYTLSGSSFNPALPKPSLELDPGAVTVQFDAAARIAGSGVLSLEFQPLFPGSVDTAIAFASGVRTLEFTFDIGDQRPLSAAFQTGTTAGTLTFTATLGGVSASESVVIPPAPIVVVAAMGLRNSSQVEIRVSAIDNTRTAGQFVYSFFDATGAVLAAIPVDASAHFARYFQTSDGGSFALVCTFPVTGDASRIASYEVSLTNSTGTSRTPRTAF